MQEGTDWVRARSFCTMDYIFDYLKERVGEDVEAMREVKASRKFVLRESAKGIYPPSFQVEEWPPDSDPQKPAQGYNVPNQIIYFTRRSEKIEIEWWKDPSQHEPPRFVSCEWHRDTVSCEIKLEEEPIELWEISERVLYPMFFGE